MSSRMTVVRIVVLVTALVVTGGFVWIATSQTKAAAPKLQDRLALGENEVRQLLLLIDTEKKGKISKQEWMKFMEAEFDRLDKSKNGELDVKELMQSRLRVSHFTSVGK
jgi:Ca2+-binding EF-hand superfamily protein